MYVDAWTEHTQSLPDSKADLMRAAYPVNHDRIGKMDADLADLIEVHSLAVATNQSREMVDALAIEIDQLTETIGEAHCPWL